MTANAAHHQQQQIVLRHVSNGIIVDTGSIQVFEVSQGKARAVSSALQAVANALRDSIGDVSCDIRVQGQGLSGEETVGDNPRMWLTPAEVEALYGISHRQLEELRRAGQGPTYSQPSPRVIRYYRPDMDAWLQRSTVKTRS